MTRGSSKENSVEVLKRIQQDLAKAWVEGDIGFIENTLAHDWSVTDVTGRVLTKNEVIREAFGTNDREIFSMNISDVDIRPFDDWAIVTGETQAVGSYQGQHMEVRLRFTDVFVFREGRWQAVASHATLLGR